MAHPLSLMVVASDPRLLWYITRGTGVVAMLLLTIAVVLGVLATAGVSSRRWPGFATQRLHRNVSLLTVAFVGLHILTTVTDGFIPIGWTSAVLPGQTPYRTFWIALGTISTDLLIAIVISSLIRVKIGQTTWRAVHWLAYASWPLALVHGLGAGTDTHYGLVPDLTLACVAAVALSIGWRLSIGWPASKTVRLVAAVITVAGTVSFFAWVSTGTHVPFASGDDPRRSSPGPSGTSAEPRGSAGTLLLHGLGGGSSSYLSASHASSTNVGSR